MNIPSEAAKPKKPIDIFETSDYDLVLLSQVMESGEHTRSLARAEQTRRQTQAIHNFNQASSRLAWIMIAVAVIQILVALLRK